MSYLKGVQPVAYIEVAVPTDYLGANTRKAGSPRDPNNQSYFPPFHNTKSLSYMLGVLTAKQ